MPAVSVASGVAKEIHTFNWRVYDFSFLVEGRGDLSGVKYEFHAGDDISMPSDWKLAFNLDKDGLISISLQMMRWNGSADQVFAGLEVKTHPDRIITLEGEFKLECNDPFRNYYPSGMPPEKIKFNRWEPEWRVWRNCGVMPVDLDTMRQLLLDDVFSLDIKFTLFGAKLETTSVGGRKSVDNLTPALLDLMTRGGSIRH